MWSRRSCRYRPDASGLEELRARRREQESALRKARRQQQLVSKRILREESLVNGDGQAGVEIASEPLSEQEILQLLRDVQRGTEERKKLLSRLRQGLQHKETQQKFVRLEGSMRVLIGLFTSSLANVQMEAARCLHELSHSSDPAVAEACLPATSYLLTYLSGHSVEFTELCLYTLGNLAVESDAVRKQLLPQGIIPALASCIQSPHVAVQEGLGYVLSQLLQAREAPTKIIPLVLDSVLPQHMLRLVSSNPELGMGVAVEFAWCLHYIVCSHVNNSLLISQGIVSTLVLLLLELASMISKAATEGLELLICPVLRCLSNLLAEDETEGCKVQIQDERLLVALFLFMQYFLQQHPFLVQECLWLLNNLTADEPIFCSAVLTLDLLPALLQLLSCSRMVTLLALTVLCNIAEKGPAYCHQLHQKAVLPSLLSTLALSDAQVVGQSLELLHLLFLHLPEAADDFLSQAGLQALEQHQDNPQLQERVRALSKTYLQPAAASLIFCAGASAAVLPSS
ncbi:transmembrane and coiled-coil domain-containing protein 6 isoform X1 [Gopherus flavomarginatus]|uniref:transmembrane and coiled-coil domain-containing protein 6 isoform X1 n=1 Tax=Gopherus flavomarginatus TaxID=286002 RepID=UPI0021CC328D|nr:transmembrane and coiled-coil domain-containing protein 6 isoform X1 [Gopherus flavomarginatus]